MSNESRHLREESGPRAAADGVVEELKGRVKEAVGAVTGRGELRDEGRAQQDKAGALREVAAKEAEADEARAEAAVHEADQRSHQD